MGATVRQLSAYALCAAFALNLNASAIGQGKQDFTLVNGSGHDIAEVYVATTGSDDWHADVLGPDILESGDSVGILFEPREKICIYDLKVVYTDAEEAEWDRFDLCTVSTITIRYNSKTGETSADYE